MSKISTPVKQGWLPTYSVGHALLDAQHRALFDLCCQASACAEAGVNSAHDRIAFSELIDDLMAYATRHIAYEESLLSQRGYPALARHAENHTALLAGLTDLVYQHLRTPQGPKEIAYLAWGWWSDHVLVQDQHFKDWVQSTPVT